MEAGLRLLSGFSEDISAYAKARLEGSGVHIRTGEAVEDVGDVAVLAGEDGKLLPGLAQVAKQQGVHLGRSLAAHIVTGEPLLAFRYNSRGNTAIVGRHAAVFEQGQFRVKGWFAWIAWAVIHVYLLVGFQHRFLVSMQWLWRYLTYDRGARLIPVTTSRWRTLRRHRCPEIGCGRLHQIRRPAPF